MARSTRATGDLLIINGPARCVAVSVQKTLAAVTAGVLTIYDNTSAAGTIIWRHQIDAATDIPFNVALLARCLTGIFVDFDATLAGVAVTVTFDTEN